MTCQERVEGYLQANRIPFGVHPHPPAFTAQAVADHEHIPNQLMVKVVIVVADGALAMLVLPTSRRVDLASVSALLSAREVRLASEAEIAAAFPDSEVGATPPFGNLYGLPVYADRSLEGDRVIFFQAGSHTLAMSVSYADFRWLVQPTMASFALHYRHTSHEDRADVKEAGGW